jgi:hypothetical protein
MNPVTTFIGLNEKRFFKETGLFPFARIREPGPGGPKQVSVTNVTPA